MIDRSDPYGNEDKNRKHLHAAFREFAANIKLGAYPELGNLLGNNKKIIDMNHLYFYRTHW